MYTSKIKNFFFATAIIMAVSLNFTSANASVLRVINENTEAVVVNVVPEPESENAPYCKTCLKNLCNVPQNGVAKIKVPVDALKCSDHYAVVGSTGGVLFNGKCKNLSATKNYELRFLNDLVGTSCISREI